MRFDSKWSKADEQKKPENVPDVSHVLLFYCCSVKLLHFAVLVALVTINFFIHS